MTIHVHHLAGCAPEPLSHYLKALGVFRLVAEQPDPRARALWKDDVFTLVTSLDETALSRFFLHDYAPTPLVAPWNGGSGFYPNDTKEGIDRIAASPAQRFQAYRSVIAQARGLVVGMAESPKKEEKNRLLQRCRSEWTVDGLSWLNAAVVLTGEDSLQYPGLLGTGGNDGRLDFTNNQMQRLVELFDTATGAPQGEATQLLGAALFGGAVAGLQRRAIGQFSPGSAGGANQTSGYAGDALINPWDFVLMLEGAIFFQVAAVRRLDSSGLSQASAPFAVRAQAGSYASACATDESARGEQWMPLWQGAASLAEVRALFAEGRLQAGGDRAHKALDAARAVARVGVARGISSFVRFGYIERNGQSNLAVPLGRWPVQMDPNVELLDEIDPWVQQLRRASHAAGAPASAGRALRQIESAMLAVCRGGSGERWQRVLLALAEAEDLLVARPKATVEARLQPIPRLSPPWLDATDDGSAEMRIARAIASQTGPIDRRSSAHFGPIRAHCLPLDPASGFLRFAAGSDRLHHDPRVVWTGRDLVADLGRVAMRRVMEHERFGSEAFPLHGRAFAMLDDVGQFLRGELDEARIAGLGRAFMAINWPAVARPAPLPPSKHPSALHAIFRLAYAPVRVDALVPRCDPAPLRLLLAGRLDAAAKAALRRFGTSGIRTKIRNAVGSPELAARLAAAIAIPVALPDLAHLLRLICKPSDFLHQLERTSPSLTDDDESQAPTSQE